MDSSIIISIESSNDFSDEDCISLQLMRNKEYPTVLEPTTFERTEKWLKYPDRRTQYITARDVKFKLPELIGILTFAEHIEHPRSLWFSMVIKREYQRQGIGKKMLDIAKTHTDELRAFCVEHDKYVKEDGSTYFAPLDFYKKNGFIVGDKTLKTEIGLECVEIIWRKEI